MDCELVVATEDDIEQIKEISNEAFLADAFFKREECYYRFQDDDLRRMLKQENAMFLTIVHPEDAKTCKSRRLIGSIYFQWQNLANIDKEELIGSFSAVSVPSRYGGKGIGKALVQGAENKLLEIATTLQVSSVTMRMEVINLRKDLFPWYEKQGYVIVDHGNYANNHPQFSNIIKPSMLQEVWLVTMEKKLQ